MTTTTEADPCCSSCATAGRHGPPAISCTLDVTAFNQRAASIRALASRYLLSSKREPLKLYLIYAAAALSDLRSIVAVEAECSPFLTFDIQEAEQIELTITAPASATSAANELFAHFLPDLVKVLA